MGDRKLDKEPPQKLNGLDIRRVFVSVMLGTDKRKGGAGVLGPRTAVSLPHCQPLVEAAAQSAAVRWVMYDSSFAFSVGDNLRLCKLTRLQFDQQPLQT
jgi:hypothetical protein